MIIANFMAIIEGLRNWTMPTPPLFGIFHITFIFLTIISTSLLIRFCRNSSVKVMKRIVFLTWITIFVLEVGKQMIFGIFTPNYSWVDFPFQFCETPIFILPALLFINNKEVRSAIIAFLCTYVFFAGLALTLIPLTLLSDNVFFNIRTLVQHAAQVVIGLYLFSWNRKNFSHNSFIFGSLIFLSLTLVAVILNFTIGKNVAGFNMFWISKYNPTELLILKQIQPHVPYIIFVLFYIFGFGFCAFSSFTVETGIYKLWLKYKPEPLDELKTKID